MNWAMNSSESKIFDENAGEIKILQKFADADEPNGDVTNIE
jgi:hypothetical protein